MKKISVSDLSGLNKMGAGVSPAQGANVNANVNGAVAMAPRAASADSSDDDEPPVWHFYMYDAVVEAEYYRPYEPKEEEPDPGYGGGGGVPEWPQEGYYTEGYTYVDTTGYTVYGYPQYYGYGETPDETQSRMTSWNPSSESQRDENGCAFKCIHEMANYNAKKKISLDDVYSKWREYCVQMFGEVRGNLKASQGESFGLQPGEIGMLYNYITGESIAQGNYVDNICQDKICIKIDYDNAHAYIIYGYICDEDGNLTDYNKWDPEGASISIVSASTVDN